MIHGKIEEVGLWEEQDDERRGQNGNTSIYGVLHVNKMKKNRKIK